ncbi:MAG: MBL fold metallo-hydrolase [Planctomycetota bacterium]
MVKTDEIRSSETGIDMSALEVLPDLFFIERGYLNGNHFVYRSKEPILIDTAYVSDFDETKKLIADLGIDIAATRLIINTHSHCDHIGGNRLIQEESGCDIAIHKVGKYFIDTGDDWSTWWRYFDQEAEFFTCTIALDDGDIISIGPYEFQVIYTPGHASDGIVLYNKQERILISSDALWEKDMPGITVRIEGSRALFAVQESLEKLKSLDVKIVYPGHGRPFTDIKAAIARSEQRVETYLNHREKLGTDLLKKIIVYTLLMHKTIEEDLFFSQLMGTHWFKETIDLYFNGNYEEKYNRIMQGLRRRSFVKRENGKLFTTVKP